MYMLTRYCLCFTVAFLLFCALLALGVIVVSGVL